MHARLQRLFQRARLPIPDAMMSVFREETLKAKAEVERTTQEIAQLEYLTNTLRQTNRELQLDIVTKTQKLEELANTHTFLVNLAIIIASAGLLGVVASAALYMKARKKK